MSNVQPTHNFLTPILLVTQAEVDQQAATKDLLTTKLAWVQDQLVNNPQLQWLNQEKETITIETVRNLIGELAYASHLGKKRAFILLAADQLSSAAQHAFLKSLEEPPTNTQLILVTTQPQKLLPTIHSRCLKHHHSIQDSSQDQLAQNLKPTLKKLLLQPQTVNYQDLIKLAQDHKDRHQAQQLLQTSLQQLQTNSELKNQLELSRLIKAQEQLSVSLQHLQANLNVRLTLEDCLFQLRN